ncbi:GntR family transcriptional regulator [Sphingopyxis terrae]|uniref:Transcriptional regulator, GntR family n=1 Tax=Sphingopyxis terrae subsp. ummariensis TaxID=429001 RepID=A0A1Y6FPD7_9SPHN|nr:GntR family transcriptional regulator [Sphingopyxis terrae]SMQ76609.1 transcriptional regulator, GntR family [Sphingopyxis terrae subsp. ummariensis]
MSPGATMERVYRELKARIMNGAFAPGERLDPSVLARDLGASATPVRDALHRLSGERIIDSWHQEGFRQPILTEADLHDLYHWAASLLTIALQSQSPDPRLPDIPIGDQRHSDYAGEVARLFRAMAWLSENRELRFALANMVERSHVFRGAELRIDPGCRAAIAAIDEDLRFRRWSALRAKVTRFHHRRIALAGRVVAEMRPREQPLG